jgi:hypothetical protein
VLSTLTGTISRGLANVCLMCIAFVSYQKRECNFIRWAQLREKTFLECSVDNALDTAEKTTVVFADVGTSEVGTTITDSVATDSSSSVPMGIPGVASAITDRTEGSNMASSTVQGRFGAHMSWWRHTFIPTDVVRTDPGLLCHVSNPIHIIQDTRHYTLCNGGEHASLMLAFLGIGHLQQRARAKRHRLASR